MLDQLQQLACKASELAIDFTPHVKSEDLSAYYAVRKAIDDVRFEMARLSGVLAAREQHERANAC